MRNRSNTRTAVAQRNQEIARLRLWGGVTVLVAGIALGLTALAQRFIG
jgi:hypothetical protein